MMKLLRRLSSGFSAGVLALGLLSAPTLIPTQAGADVPDREKVVRSVRVDGISRSYTAYLPGNLTRMRNVRVLFAFHPATATAGYMADATEFHEMPESEDYIVIYLEGFQRTWNVETCCGAAESRGVDDVAFFLAMMSDVGRMADIRPDAYLTGFSNGALLVYHLMCEAGDRVAAAAPFAAYLPPSQLRNCHGGPIPLLHMHGDADPGAPVEGGDTSYLGPLPPALETVAAVARMNGASTRRSKRVASPLLDATCEKFEGRSSKSEASLCVVEGLGHHWPGARASGPGRTYGPSRPDVRGSEAVLEFFNRF
jgi:polyhydroxybutyrate depolymerase